MKLESQRLWLAGVLLVAGVAVALFALRPGASSADGSGADAAPPTLGEPPPAFDAETIVGDDTPSLAAHRGEVVVVAFVSTRCRACHRALAELRDLVAAKRAEGLRVLALVSEPPDRVRTFVRQAELDFTFARVPEATANRYGVRFIPDMFVVDREGRLRGRVTGAQDPDIAELRALVDRLL